MRVRARTGRVDTVPVGRPLPDISDHIERAERARTDRKATHRCRGLPSIAVLVHHRPRHAQTLTDLAAFAAAGVEPFRARRVVPPWVRPSVVAARRVLPFGLARQSLVHRLAVRLGLVPVYAVDRVVLTVGACAVAKAFEAVLRWLRHGRALAADRAARV